KGQQDQADVQDGHAVNVLQKAGFENILKSHAVSLLSFIVSAVDPAGRVFGKGRCVGAGDLDHVPDRGGQKGVPLHLQDHRHVPSRHRDAAEVQKVRAGQTGADIVV